MGSFSDYLELELLDHVFKVGSYTAPTNLFIALCKSTIDDTKTGATLPSEVSGGSYVRKQCNTWATAASGATSNNIAITFAQATADWGTVTHFAILDLGGTTTSKGNMLAWGALSVSKNVQSGDTAKFATNDLDVTLD